MKEETVKGDWGKGKCLTFPTHWLFVILTHSNTAVNGHTSVRRIVNSPVSFQNGSRVWLFNTLSLWFLERERERGWIEESEGAGNIAKRKLSMRSHSAIVAVPLKGNLWWTMKYWKILLPSFYGIIKRVSRCINGLNQLSSSHWTWTTGECHKKENSDVMIKTRR